MSKQKQHDITAIKIAASGRWTDIFHTLTGVEIDPNTKKHGPCPKCGGVDRFRMLDAKSGALFCNQCFKTNNGDGIAALQWLTGRDFKDTIKELADYLNVAPSAANGHASKKPAAAKGSSRIYATPQGLVRSILPSIIKKHGPGVKLAAYWRYPTFTVLRFNLPTPSDEKQRKEFRPIHQVPLGSSGAAGWKTGYPDGLRPLYHLMEIQPAAADLITIHGGEKATDAAAKLGIVTTTNAGGEQAIKKTDWSPLARFKMTAIVVDNDAAGEKFGKMLAWVLRQQAPEQIIKIVRLPNLPPKGDVVEWIAAGGTKEDFLRIIENLPAAEATAVKLPGEVNEAEDDPHRLARVNLEQYATQNNGRTLIYWRDEWFVWKENRYKAITEKNLRAKLANSIKAEYDRLNLLAVEEYETGRAMSGKDDDEGKPPEVRKVSVQIVSGVLQATASMVFLSSDIEPGTWIPTKKRCRYVSMVNGLLDTDALLIGSEKCLSPNSPQWFSTASLPYEFNPEAICPKWDAFLEHNLEMDPERIKVLQEWVGYLLLPDTGEQRFLINEGEGANGKSVFTSAVTAVLGEENVSNVPLEVFGDRFSRSDTLGKLLNAAGDCGEIDKAAEGYIKSFTSGDRMFFDRKGVAGLNCRPTARMMVSCNTLPRFSDRSDGVWRRMLLIPWRVQIGKTERIKGMDKVEWWQDSGELPGIFNWAVAGLHRLRAQKGFSDSQVMDEAMGIYKSEVNPARQFLLETCTNVLQTETILSKELYGAYCRWCKESGHNYPLSDIQFGKEIRRVFPATKRERHTIGTRDRYYTGIRLNDF